MPSLAANARIYFPPPQPSPDWAYFLDIDGTLVDIAPAPDLAHVDATLLALAVRLKNVTSGATALISGRSLADLERRLEGLHISIAGQHGLEWRDPVGTLHRPAVASLAIESLRRRLAPLLDRYPQLLLEDKGLTLALHYRQAPQLGGYLHRLLPDMVAEAGDSLSLLKGKRVLEIKPSGGDKGTAIERFMECKPFHGRMPVFIGDDRTDEHGFAVINRLHGISIKVGRGASQARYRLRDVSAVRSWLAMATEQAA